MGGDSKLHGNMLCLFCVAVLCCVAYVSPVLPDTCSDHPDGSCTGAAMSELLSAAAAAAGSIGGGGSVWVVCSRSACIKRNTQNAKRKAQNASKWCACVCLLFAVCFCPSACVCARARACVACVPVPVPAGLTTRRSVKCSLPTRKTHLFLSAVSLRLSRACLGK